MPSDYVLIDFENVQPRNLDILKDHEFKVLVFVGANQAKVPFDLASAMQTLGDSGRYVKIAGSGKNALDFHIAYYLGELAVKEPKATFHVISKDTGFDPLIKHLQKKKLRVQRKSNLAEIPKLQISVATSSEEKVAAIIENLSGRGHSRPRKVKTLCNTINSLFTEHMSDQQLMVLVKELEQRRYIVVNDGKVSYKQPQQKEGGTGSAK